MNMNKNTSASFFPRIQVAIGASFLSLFIALQPLSASEEGTSDSSQEEAAEEENKPQLQLRSVLPIRGAFGVDLGQSRDSIIDYARRRVQDRLYVLEATRPDPNFSRYLVMFDDKNENVVSITGLGQFQGTTAEQCEQRFVIYKSALERKHGDGQTRERNETTKQFELQNTTGTRKIFLTKEFQETTCALQFVVTEVN